MTLKLGLVDIFTNTQINTIGLFDWQYRGDGGILVTVLLVCKFLPTSLPGKGFICKILQFSVYMNVQDLSVFYIDFVSDSAFEGI